MKAFILFAILAGLVLAASASAPLSPLSANMSRRARGLDSTTPTNFHRLTLGSSEKPGDAFELRDSSLHNHDFDIAAHYVQEPPTPPTPPQNTPFGLASTILTARPKPTTAPPNEVHAAASTVTLHPTIIETAVPNARPPTMNIILPFKIQLWEYCTVDNSHLAAGMYANGNLKSALNLSPGLVMSVKHFVPWYENLEIGGFDFAKGRVRFRYRGCEWWDHETWKSCGECRAGLWSGEPVECGGGAMVVRLKEMECSVLLGTRLGVQGEGA